MPPRPLEKYMTFESKFSIGEKIKLTVIQSSPIYGYVRTVTFTSGKVRYSIFIKEVMTTLHNIDSVFIEKVDGDKETITFDFDNYS